MRAISRANSLTRGAGPRRRLRGLLGGRGSAALCRLCPAQACQAPLDRGRSASAKGAGKASPRTRTLQGIAQVCSKVKWAFLTLQLLSINGGDWCSPLGLEEKTSSVQLGKKPSSNSSLQPQSLLVSLSFPTPIKMTTPCFYYLAKMLISIV